MTKRERLEDLGVLLVMLRELRDMQVLQHTESKHCYDTWKMHNHDKVEYGEERGLDGIFCDMRQIADALDACIAVAWGDHENS